MPSDKETQSELPQERKTLYLKLRMVFVLWFAADFFYHYNAHTTGLAAPVALLAVYLASQGVLFGLPRRYFEGGVLTYGLFIFDLSFVLLSLYLMGQATFQLMTALFLTLFMAALAQSLVYTLLIALVVCAVYLGLRLQTPEGFEYAKPSDFLDLPFILIVGMHAASLVRESLLEHREIFSLESARKLLKDELKKSARRIDDLMADTELVFDALPLAMVVVDENGVVRVFNTQAEQAFKFYRRKVLSRSMKDVPLLAPFRSHLAEGLLGGFQPQIVDFKDYDGKPKRMLLGMVRTRDQKGGVSGVMAMLSPASSEEQGEPLAVMFQAKPAPVVPTAPPDEEAAPQDETLPKPPMARPPKDSTQAGGDLAMPL